MAFKYLLHNKLTQVLHFRKSQEKGVRVIPGIFRPVGWIDTYGSVCNRTSSAPKSVKSNNFLKLNGSGRVWVLRSKRSWQLSISVV